MLTPLLATLVYVLSPDRSRVLMLHRNKRVDDIHFGKYNGLGGKVEPDEDVVSCAIREVAELILQAQGTWKEILSKYEVE